MLVSVGRAALVEGIGLEAAGVSFDRKGIGTDDHRAHERGAHLRRRRRRRLLAARAHRFPRGRGRRRERDGARVDVRRAGGAAADLHRPGDRRRRVSPRRRRASSTATRVVVGPRAVGGDRARGDVGGHHGLGEDDPRVDLRRAARHRDRRPARDRPDRRGRRRARRGGDDRDDRRRCRAAPDLWRRASRRQGSSRSAAPSTYRRGGGRLDP